MEGELVGMGEERQEGRERKRGGCHAHRMRLEEDDYQERALRAHFILFELSVKISNLKRPWRNSNK